MTGVFAEPWTLLRLLCPDVMGEYFSAHTIFASFNPAFKAVILEKEKRGEVFFLKPESLEYRGFGTGGDPEAFPKVCTSQMLSFVW